MKFVYIIQASKEFKLFNFNQFSHFLKSFSNFENSSGILFPSCSSKPCKKIDLACISIPLSENLLRKLFLVSLLSKILIGHCIISGLNIFNISSNSFFS